MSTYMAHKETVTRKWYILDAAGKPLGKTAATAAHLLRGKHKPEYTPNVDCGDFVIVLNAAEAVLSSSLRLDRWSEGDQVPYPDAGEARVRDGDRRQGYDAQEQPGRFRAPPPACLSWR